MTKFLTILTFALWLAFSLAIDDGPTPPTPPNGGNLETKSNEIYPVEFIYGKETNLACANSNDLNFEIAVCDWIKDDCSPETEQGGCLKDLTVFQTTNECKLKFPKIQKHHEGIYTSKVTASPDVYFKTREVASKLTNCRSASTLST